MPKPNHPSMHREHCKFGEVMPGWDAAQWVKRLRYMAERVESAAENPLIGDSETRERNYKETLKDAQRLRDWADVVERKP